MTLYVEVNDGVDKEQIERNLAQTFKSKIGMTPVVSCVDMGVLPRSEKKTKRVIDQRYE